MSNKQFLSIAVAIILVLVMILPACAKPAPAPPVKPIELTLAQYSPPPRSPVPQFFADWSNEVEQRTGGRVKITIYWAEALGKMAEQYDTVVAGGADIVWGLQGVPPGRFPLDNVMELPFMFPASSVANSHIIWELYPEFLAPEYSEVKVIGLHTTAPLNLFTSTKPIRTLEDLKGMKIRAPDAVGAKVIESLGAVPTFIPVTELYHSLERGVVEGALTGWGPLQAFRWYEVLEYGTVVNTNCTPQYFVMNLDTWQRLPPDIQEIIDEVSGEYVAQKIGEAYDEEILIGKEAAIAAGMELYTVPPAELNRFKEAVAPVYDWWVADIEAKGLPGGQLLEAAQRLAEKYAEK